MDTGPPGLDLGIMERETALHDLVSALHLSLTVGHWCPDHAWTTLLDIYHKTVAQCTLPVKMVPWFNLHHAVLRSAACMSHAAHGRMSMLPGGVHNAVDLDRRVNGRPRTDEAPWGAFEPRDLEDVCGPTDIGAVTDWEKVRSYVAGHIARGMDTSRGKDRRADALRTFVRQLELAFVGYDAACLPPISSEGRQALWEALYALLGASDSAMPYDSLVASEYQVYQIGLLDHPIPGRLAVRRFVPQRVLLHASEGVGRWVISASLQAHGNTPRPGSTAYHWYIRQLLPREDAFVYQATVDGMNLTRAGVSALRVADNPSEQELRSVVTASLFSRSGAVIPPEDRDLDGRGFGEE